MCLQENGMIARDWRSCKDAELPPSILRSGTLLSDKQQKGVVEYWKLMIQMKSNVETIISSLKSQKSTIQELETPEITLRKLSDVFEDSVQEKGDVIGWFSDNQSNYIIDLAEQKWSWKSILTAIGAIALGVAQIVAGAVLLVTTAGTGSFFCNALISEGVSDMIFGVEGLVKGHCTWSQYWDNKVMSIAITVATAGLGAVFARGKEASKYAYKAFGNASKELMKSTAKETGGAVSKVIAKEVGKKIGKKVVGAVAEAGINLAVEAIVDQMSQAMQSFSDMLINAYDSMCGDEKLNEKMNTFLHQQEQDKAEKYLHDITTKILRDGSFLDLMDEIEDIAQKGVGVVTQAHSKAASHLQGKNIRGQKLVKVVSNISRFAPFVTETAKGFLIKVKMEKVKESLIKRLTQEEVKQAVSPPSDARIKEIKDKEITAMKQQFSQEVSQRGKKVATMALQMAGNAMKSAAIKATKDFVIKPAEEHISMSKLQKYERKLKAAGSDQSQIQKYKQKLQRLMSRTRSPAVFARLIEHHDALLGPAFALPALEILVGRPIALKFEDGREVMNVQESFAQGEPIKVTFTPGRDGKPGHYYFGDQVFTPDQHGNNCLIKAVLAGAGKTDMTLGEARKHIANACKNEKHPSHRYITSGIASNYVKVGVIGGKVVFTGERFTGKAQWFSQMDHFLFHQDHEANTRNLARGVSLREAGVHRCHQLSEKSIQDMVLLAKKDKKIIKLLREELLPTTDEVSSGVSAFENSSTKNAFLSTYSPNSVQGIKYSTQVAEVDTIIKKWGSNQLSSADYVTLVTNLSNSPVNVRLGHAKINSSIGSAMDYNPNSSISRRLYTTFHDIPGFHPPKTEGGQFISSFLH